MAFTGNFQWFSTFSKMPFLHSKFCTYGKVNTIMPNNLIFTNFNPCVIMFNCTLKLIHSPNLNFSLLMVSRYFNIYV